MAKFKKRKFYADGNKQTIAAPVTIAEAVIVKSKSENTEEVTLKNKIKEFEDKNIELSNKDTELDNKDAALTEDITKITQNTTKIANSDGGASAGTGSSATRGGAVGNGATVGNGFAGGYLAKAVNSDGNGIDAIQLGQGTNSIEKTLQIYGDNIYDANTHTLNVQNAKKNGVNLLTVNDSADSLKCYDTRSVNSPPSYYYGMEKGIITEFKFANTLGITNANDTYVQLVTYRAWPDKSGGGIYQTAYCYNQVLYRSSTGTDTWGEWYMVLTTKDVYPVGSIYISTYRTSPASIFGGTWELIKDRFLLGAGGTYKLGLTGGEPFHTLTIDEMPSHRHSSSSYQNGYPSTVLDTSKYATWVNNGQINNNNPNTGQDGSVRTSYVGGGQQHNNMPPYLAVNIWKRTA